MPLTLKTLLPKTTNTTYSIDFIEFNYPLLLGEYSWHKTCICFIEDISSIRFKRFN